MGDTLLTPQALATLGGAAFLTFVIVAYTKAWVQARTKLSTDLYAVMLGSVILLLAQLAIGADPRSWTLYFMAACNGFLVALAAGKMNDKTIDEAIKAEEAQRGE